MAPEVPSTAVAAGVHSIEHGLFLTEADIGVLGARHGIWVPTVCRVEALVGQLGAESSGGKLLREGLDNLRRLLPLAVEAGVLVLTGTDLAGAPSDVSAEAIKLAEYGLSETRAVEALTTSAFIATGRSADFAPGSVADAVLYPENPTGNLEVLGSPSHVIRLGTVL
jgi:imidazolonepropionase-like amidohydrolase